MTANMVPARLDRSAHAEMIPIFYADVDDIPSDIAEYPDDDDEDYRDELNLWAGRQGMVAAGTNYAQSPRSHVTGGAGADADDPLGDAFGPWEDAEPSSDDDMGVDPWS